MNVAQKSKRATIVKKQSISAAGTATGVSQVSQLFSVGETAESEGAETPSGTRPSSGGAAGANAGLGQQHRYILEARLERGSHWPLSSEQMTFIHETVAAVKMQRPSAAPTATDAKGNPTPTPASAQAVTAQPSATPSGSLSQSQSLQSQQSQPFELREQANSLSATKTMQFALYHKELLAGLARADKRDGGRQQGRAAGKGQATRAPARAEPLRAAAPIGAAQPSQLLLQPGQQAAPSGPSAPQFDESRPHWVLRLLLEADHAVYFHHSKIDIRILHIGNYQEFQKLSVTRDGPDPAC